MTDAPDTLPADAEIFACEGITGKMRGERFMAQLMMLVPLAFVLIGFGLVYGAVAESEGPPNYTAIVLCSLLGLAAVYGLFRMAWKLYKSADKLLAVADKYMYRVIVLSDDGMDIFAAAFEEKALLHYAAAGQFVVRLPWEAIEKISVRMIKYENSPQVRCYEIEGPTLPKNLDRRILVTAKHFEPVEEALFAALHRRLPYRIEQHC